MNRKGSDRHANDISNVFISQHSLSGGYFIRRCSDGRTIHEYRQATYYVCNVAFHSGIVAYIDRSSRE